MTKSNSLENINLQFRTIMGNMGLDEEKQNKLAVKMDLSRKIKTIISMQTLEERKKKIREYLDRISTTNSLMSILSLHCSIENGNTTLFSIFMTSKGPETILKSIEVMEGEFVCALLDFIFMLLDKYSCEIPNLLETILKKYVTLKFKVPAFFKILEYYVKGEKKKGCEKDCQKDCQKDYQKEYEILFQNTSPYGCVCSSYLSLIIGQVIEEGGEEKEEFRFINLLRDTDRKEYVDYVLFVHKKGCRRLNKEGPPLRGCKSERLFEIIRIAEEKKMLDLVTNLVESFVIGGRVIKEFIKEDNVKEGNPEEDNAKIEKKLGEITIKEDVPPSPSHSPPEVAPPKKTVKGPPKKIIKKIVKKTKPDKNYLQVKWNKISKKGTIFETPLEVEITEKDLEAFEKKETVRINKTEVRMKKETLFPEKKNYALNIVLSRVKLSDKELKERILSQSQGVDSNLVKQLILYFPTDEEVEALASCTPLGRAESFFKECLPEIDSIKESLYVLNFKGLLEDPLFLDQLSTLSRYYKTILSSSSLKEILSLFLHLGNRLNKGSFLGQAEGFSFDSIHAFLEMKPVLGLLKKKVPLKDFLEEFKILFDVQRLSFDNLRGDFQELSGNYKKIKSLPGDVQAKYKSIEEKFEEVLELHNQAKTYLNEKMDEEFNSKFINMYLILKGL